MRGVTALRRLGPVQPKAANNAGLKASHQTIIIPEFSCNLLNFVISTPTFDNIIRFFSDHQPINIQCSQQNASTHAHFPPGGYGCSDVIYKLYKYDVSMVFKTSGEISLCSSSRVESIRLKMLRDQ